MQPPVPLLYFLRPAGAATFRESEEMPAYAIIGGQWGDEGKGKVVDLLSADAHVVARFNGGNNAGHTVITDAGEFKFHLIPAGILRPECTCIIGNGVVVNPDSFMEEVAGLQERNVSVDRLVISDKTQVIMPYHTLLDRLEEEMRAESGKAIGTTGMGIGPAYMDKAARSGIRMADLLDEEALLRRLSFVLEQKNAIITRLYGKEAVSLEETYERCLEWGRGLRPFIRPVEPILQQAFASGQRVILEGAQGTLLDVDRRHLSLRHVVVTHGWRRLLRPRHQPKARAGDRGRVQGVHHAGGIRAASNGAQRRGGRVHTAESVGVRDHHRSAATLRLVRRGGSPVLGVHQRRDLRHSHAPGRPRRHLAGANLRCLPPGRRDHPRFPDGHLTVGGLRAHIRRPAGLGEGHGKRTQPGRPSPGGRQLPEQGGGAHRLFH